MAELDSLLEALESRLSRGGENITEEFSFREERREFTERTTTTTTRHRETRELPVKPRSAQSRERAALICNCREYMRGNGGKVKMGHKVIIPVK